MGHHGGQPHDGVRTPKNGVMWVLRFGGLMALVGALICRKVPPTKTEKVSHLIISMKFRKLIACLGYEKTIG